MSKYDVVVLGAGVLGLTIASELVEQGYKVALVARDMPEDAESVGFASPWAGCNWCSFAQGDPRGQEWDEITYKRLAKLAQTHPELCEKIQFYDVWSGTKTDPVPWYKDVVEGYKQLTEADYPLPGNHTSGYAYKSYIIHAPRYILHLAEELRRKGATFVRKRVSSLDEAYSIPEIGPVNVVVNATGLGSQTLLGIEDKECYPARGQTVLVKAPGVKTCYMMTEDLISASKGSSTAKPPTYIIPRPGPESHVILGGTYLADNYSSLVDLPTSERILQECFKLCPGLAGPGEDKTWRDIEIVSHNVGLRPSRHGGARLELEKRTLGAGENADLLPKAARAEAREVAVVHAYGIGGSGYQSSFGLAEKVAELVQSYQPQKSSEESAPKLGAFSLETLKQYLPAALTS